MFSRVTQTKKSDGRGAEFRQATRRNIRALFIREKKWFQSTKVYDARIHSGQRERRKIQGQKRKTDSTVSSLGIRKGFWLLRYQSFQIEKTIFEKWNKDWPQINKPLKVDSCLSVWQVTVSVPRGWSGEYKDPHSEYITSRKGQDSWFGGVCLRALWPPALCLLSSHRWANEQNNGADIRVQVSWNKTRKL